MPENKSLLGVVIRRDGTVPFDDDCHADVRAACLAHLAEQGHAYEPVPHTKHVRIKNWAPPNS